MKTNNTIAINGKHYDALTGKPVAGLPIPAGKHHKKIDGVVRSKTSPTQPQATHAKSAKPVASVHRQTGQAAKLHKPVASKTLMRQVVKKPTKPLHISSLKASTPTDALVYQPEVAVAPKLSLSVVDIRREARAKKIVKSKLISRFGDFNLAPTTSSAARAAAPAISQPTQPVVSRPTLQHTPAPGGQRSMDIFQRALTKANAHEQPKLPRASHARAKKRHSARSHRLANISTAALAVLVIGGFLAYQNIANVTVRLASAKAGFAASLPGYRPSGFSVGKFAYSPGNVTINFHSNSDNRHFAVVEQPSNWNSETLLNDFVATAAQDYRTVQTAGRTVYIYGQNNATWVANGVWYRITSQDSLSTTQVVNLASSM